MAHPFTNFQKYKDSEFQSYILPIIPAGAKKTPDSRLNEGQLGKIPGQYRPDVKAWIGFPNWPVHNAKAGHMDWWQRWQTQADTAIALGMILGDYVAIDIDSDDEPTADEIEARATLEIGVSPVVRLRCGSSRRVLFYARDQHTRPIRKFRLAFKTADGQQHAVEVLAAGQQVIVEGPHAKGSMHYWRDGGLLEHRDWLKTNLITADQIGAMMKSLEPTFLGFPMVLGQGGPLRRRRQR